MNILGHRNTLNYEWGRILLFLFTASPPLPPFLFLTKSKKNTIQKLYSIKIYWKNQFTKWGGISLEKFILLKVQKLNPNWVSVSQAMH